MASSYSLFTEENFKQFHNVDRSLYTILVLKLFRDPLESMQVLALWLWLERDGFKNVVKKMLSLPYILINELADEAVTCLGLINGTHFSLSSEQTDIPLMQSFLEKEISVQFFHENRDAAARGVTKAVNEVCLPAFDDIMQKTMERNFAQNSVDHRNVVLPSQRSSSSLASQQPSSSSLFPFSLSNNEQPYLQQQQPLQMRNEVAPPHDRTMFVTFSKGYPVQESEVRQFFTMTFGARIESLQMQEVQPHEQSLFAKIVFHSPATIEAILNGMRKAKFTINGKHIWVRRYEPRRTRSLLPPIAPFGARVGEGGGLL
ncbi:uncharacterized protein LOC103929732 [Pyrus x bretschneideri]|uniref:uncharacterized protein LOC103929732 n=1 Tax=Pyrus x bretschneideri TaxID=225117 RepID=UPI002030FD05|nr:uncharacterized protein LOC103929732 [Pyrus x bretschneideri]